MTLFPAAPVIAGTPLFLGRTRVPPQRPAPLDPGAALVSPAFAKGIPPVLCRVGVVA